MAFKRRHLIQLTKPIHLFCLKNDAPHPSLTIQYKNDLIERWMFKGDVNHRYQHGRKYLGRLVELLFAAWLHQEGWRLEALEALGGRADVATDPDEQSFSFEIKYLAQNEVLFELGVKALSGDGVSGGGIPVYSPIDYLIFRIFEAARQLECRPNPKIVAVILSDYDVYFATPLKESWIEWRNPRFFRKEGDIENLLKKQYQKHPNLDHDIKHYISQIDQIWFYGISEGLMMRRRQIEKVRGR